MRQQAGTTATCLLFVSTPYLASGFCDVARLCTFSQPRDHYYCGRAHTEFNTKTRRRQRNGRPNTRSCPSTYHVSPVMVMGATPDLAAASGNAEMGMGGISLEEEGLSRPSNGQPLVDCRQLSPDEVRRRWPDTNFDVPDTVWGAARTFIEHPTPRIILLGVVAVAMLRLSCGVALGVADAVALPTVAVGWSFQEWAIHKYLLHGFEKWLGYDVHNRHHDKPFYHICVDPPDLVMGWTLAAASLFRLLLPTPLALTVLGVYMVMGGVYEWTHYIVHTRVVPRSRFGKELKRHHTLHHLKDDSCWLAFTAPPIDYLLGTVPQGSSNEAGLEE